ncbi:glycosyltransferase [Halobacillus aidingensis]|uniref:Glycosyltransferase involved in cell wall bisynthesis n=1 Tax=Halobacillus aidingensis TaxID=240303 RepID=A0A1H0KJB7_HALAD|nr:glycosyltransferase [Halobacillus aidingensis]SDO56039.1 Glycosyltransferase involved in cell wall bisynthesis [Halobacillus aidingensis]
MKIFVIPSAYPNDCNPNSGTFVHEQCRALKQDGHEVIVLDATAYGYKNWFISNVNNFEKSKIDDVEIYAMHYRGLMSTRIPRLAVHCYLNRLRILYQHAIAEHGLPDLFFAHFTFTSGYGALILSKETGIPYIVTEHHSLFLKSNLHPFIKRITIEVIEGASAFICVSEHLRTAMKKFEPANKKICVVPNLIDDKFRFAPMPSAPPFIFFSAGNLVENKNFHLLIEAFCRAFSKQEKVILKIAGSGPEKSRLEKLIRYYGREKQIYLLGNLKRDVIMNFFKECHCFVLPSKYETFGIVYREAMAVGRPVISSRNGGVLDGWNEQYGRLLSSNDIESCKSEMIYMYKNINMYNSKLISKYTVEKYSKAAVVKNINRILKNIM